MSDIFYVLDKFNITGRGFVYIVKLKKDTTLRLGDFLYDLQGNKFKISGIEMFRIDDFDENYFKTGILLENPDSVEVKGNILVKNLADVNFLFCSCPFNKNEVDETYADEYRYAQKHRNCALFSYEDFSAGELKLYGDDITGLTVYRGWMMNPEMYRRLYKALEKKDIYLINTPEEYERYHLLPGWYDSFRNETAITVWTEGNKLDDVLNISKTLEGSYIIKDYVKSRKHEWYDACFIRNIADKKDLEKVARNFIVRQGEDLTGGIVLRKYEKLKATRYHEQSGMPLSEEYRVFVYAGEILAINDYWAENNSLNITDEEYKWIESIVAKIQSNFVTVDLARREDGTLIIMELGDGQVSGLQQLKADTFYKAFRKSSDKI